MSDNIHEMLQQALHLDDYEQNKELLARLRDYPVLMFGQPRVAADNHEAEAGAQPDDASAANLLSSIAVEQCEDGSLIVTVFAEIPVDFELPAGTAWSTYTFHEILRPFSPATLPVTLVVASKGNIVVLDKEMQYLLNLMLSSPAELLRSALYSAARNEIPQLHNIARAMWAYCAKHADSIERLQLGLLAKLNGEHQLIALLTAKSHAQHAAELARLAHLLPEGITLQVKAANDFTLDVAISSQLMELDPLYTPQQPQGWFSRLRMRFAKPEIALLDSPELDNLDKKDTPKTSATSVAEALAV